MPGTLIPAALGSGEGIGVSRAWVEVPAQHLCISSPSDGRKWMLKEKRRLLSWGQLCASLGEPMDFLPLLISGLDPTWGSWKTLWFAALVLCSQFRKHSSAASCRALWSQYIQNEFGAWAKGLQLPPRPRETRRSKMLFVSGFKPVACSEHCLETIFVIIISKQQLFN